MAVAVAVAVAKAKVSAYVPAFNAEGYIAACLKGLLSQTLKFSEIVVIDDASEDRTARIAESHGVRVIRKKRWRGLAHSRNLAAKLARYSLVASIDADVILDRDWLKNILPHFKPEKVAGVCGNLTEGENTFTQRWRKVHCRQDWGDRVCNPPFLFGSDSVFRKDVLLKFRYNEQFARNYEDVEIAKRIKSCGLELVYAPKAECRHLKQDTLSSLLSNYYSWTFHSYPIPDTFIKLLYRLGIANVHKAASLLAADIHHPENIPFDLLVCFSHSYQDVKYFIGKDSGIQHIRRS